jgi:hypothetical protein
MTNWAMSLEGVSIPSIEIIFNCCLSNPQAKEEVEGAIKSQLDELKASKAQQAEARCGAVISFERV